MKKRLKLTCQEGYWRRSTLLDVGELAAGIQEKSPMGGILWGRTHVE